MQQSQRLYTHKYNARVMQTYEDGEPALVLNHFARHEALVHAHTRVLYVSK